MKNDFAKSLGAVSVRSPLTKYKTNILIQLKETAGVSEIHEVVKVYIAKIEVDLFLKKINRSLV